MNLIKNKKKIAAVIPVFNEEKDIKKLLIKIKKYAFPILVNDGSTDKTYEMAKIKGILIINHKNNLGYDAAINNGIKKAMKLGYNKIVTLDGDGQHLPSEIKKISNCLGKNYKLVVGKRKKYQRFSENIFGFLTNIFWGIKDPLCGMKGYGIDYLKKIKSFNNYKSIGTELLLKALKNNYKIKQVDIKIKLRKDKSRFGNIFSGNFQIIRAIIFGFFFLKKDFN